MVIEVQLDFTTVVRTLSAITVDSGMICCIATIVRGGVSQVGECPNEMIGALGDIEAMTIDLVGFEFDGREAASQSHGCILQCGGTQGHFPMPESRGSFMNAVLANAWISCWIMQPHDNTTTIHAVMPSANVFNAECHPPYQAFVDHFRIHLVTSDVPKEVRLIRNERNTMSIVCVRDQILPTIAHASWLDYHWTWNNKFLRIGARRIEVAMAVLRAVDLVELTGAVEAHTLGCTNRWAGFRGEVHASMPAVKLIGSTGGSTQLTHRQLP